jgi:hypothetical protein
MLALASLPLKAEEANKDKAMSARWQGCWHARSLRLCWRGATGPSASARWPAAGGWQLAATCWTRMAAGGAACLVAGAGLVN